MALPLGIAAKDVEGIANSVDPDQNALILVYTACLDSHLHVQNLKILTVSLAKVVQLGISFRNCSVQFIDIILQ